MHVKIQKGRERTKEILNRINQELDEKARAAKKSRKSET